MKFIQLFVIVFFFVTCEDIGNGYKWQGESGPGFSRRYGTVGYDYGWNAAYSPFDGGTIIVGQKTTKIVGGHSDLWAIKVDNRGLMQWEKNFGGKGDDVGYDVISTSDGGFLFLGFTWSYANEQQVYAIKTDFHGNIIWEKVYGGGMWDVGNAVIEIAGGGYMIAGYSNSPGISSGNTDIFLIKIDNNGEIIWQKAYGNPAFPNHEWGNDIIQLDDKGYIVVGARDRYDKGSINGLVIRLDNEGNLIWEKEFAEEGQVSENIYSISKALDGGFFLCITSNSIKSENIYEPRIIKIDPSGNVGWKRKFNSDSRKYHQFRSTGTSSGDLVIVGSSSRQLSGGHREDAFMTRIDKSGNIIWSHPYGTVDNDDWGWSVFETPMSNLVFVGSTKSYGASLFDIYLVGANSDGLSK